MRRHAAITVVLIALALAGCTAAGPSDPVPTMGAAWGPDVVPSPAVPDDSEDAGVTLTLEALNNDQSIESPLESPSTVRIVVRFGSAETTTDPISVTASLPAGVSMVTSSTTTLPTSFDDVAVEQQARYIDQDDIVGGGLDLGPIEAEAGVRVTFEVEVTADSCSLTTRTIKVAIATEARSLISDTVDMPVRDCD